MKPVLKLLTVFVLTGTIFLFSFLIWGESLEAFLDFKACTALFSDIRSWAWLIGILLLWSDLVLPIPATGVIAALGAVYGTWEGAALGVVGTAGAGILGYGTARLLGYRAARYLASDDEMNRFRLFFDQWGGYAVIISRILPMLPEIVSILAGLSGMRFSRFTAALLAGSVPACLLFSWMGQVSGEGSGAGIFMAVLVPLLIWPFVMKNIK